MVFMFPHQLNNFKSIKVISEVANFYHDFYNKSTGKTSECCPDSSSGQAPGGLREVCTE